MAADAEPGRAEVSEQAMFGGLAIWSAGTMAIAPSSQGGVLFQVDPEQSEKLVVTTNALPMEMRGWLRLAADDVRTKRQPAKWRWGMPAHCQQGQASAAPLCMTGTAAP